MVAQILDGKIVAAKIKENLYKEIIENHLNPMLSVALVGNDPASEIYVSNKQKACEQIGIRSELKRFSINVSNNEVVEWIKSRNESNNVHGILLQLPFPSQIDKNLILQQIHILKDVDSFHPENQGLLMLGNPRFQPCTPQGIIEMLKYYDIKVKGENVAIINNSTIIGKPLAMMLSWDNEWGNATVTICHEYTKDIDKICLSADIIVTAVGRSNFRLTGNMVKEGSVILDVGIFREGKKIRGDVVFEEVVQKASWISRVPGGCGPLTIACLLKNTIQAYKLQIRLMS